MVSELQNAIWKDSNLAGPDEGYRQDWIEHVAATSSLHEIYDELENIRYLGDQRALDRSVLAAKFYLAKFDQLAKPAALTAQGFNGKMYSLVMPHATENLAQAEERNSIEAALLNVTKGSAEVRKNAFDMLKTVTDKHEAKPPSFWDVFKNKLGLK